LLLRFVQIVYHLFDKRHELIFPPLRFPPSPLFSTSSLVSSGAALSGLLVCVLFARKHIRLLACLAAYVVYYRSTTMSSSSYYFHSLHE